MSTDPSIFQASPNPQVTPAQPVVQQTTTVQIDPTLLTLLGDIKNERGEPKYKSLPDAINALKHAQEYIPQLTNQLSQKDTELAQARADAAKVAELERSVLALTQQQGQPPTGTPGPTTEQIAELVNRSITQTLSQRESDQLIKANTDTVAASLVASFGTEAERKYAEKAAELGLTVQDLNILAAKSPKAVLGYFGKQPVATGAPQSTVNTAALQPHQDTFVGRNRNSTLIGATTEDLKAEQANSRKMVTELESKGMSIDDLTKPSNYFKYFGKT